MEHVLAFSLGGNWELPQASCLACADRTSKFEGVVARAFYGTLRNTANYPTRNKKGRPKSIVLQKTAPDGTKRPVVIPVENFPRIFPVVTLPLAGILTGAPLSESNPDMQIGLGADDAAEMEKLKALFEPGASFELPLQIDFYNLSLTLAKTAHAFVVANLGFDGYEPYLPDVVREVNPHRSHFVGGWPWPVGGYVGNPLLGLTITKRNGYLVVLIELFHGRLSAFGVVAGRIVDPYLLGNAQRHPRVVGKSDFVQTTPHSEDKLSPSKSAGARVKRK